MPRRRTRYLVTPVPAAPGSPARPRPDRCPADDRARPADAPAPTGSRTVQVRVHHWGRVVVEPMEHVHGHTVREPVSQIARRLEVVAGPSTIADERHREEHDRPELHVGRMPGEGADEEGPANRMADHGGSVIERP